MTNAFTLIAGIIMGGICGCVLTLLLIGFLLGINDRDFSGIDDYNSDNYNN